MVWSPHAPQGNEASKIKMHAWLYTQGKGIDVGCGNDKVIPSALGIDAMTFAGAPVADVSWDARTLPMFTDGSLDYVFSSHFLEHVVDYKATLKEWWRVLKVGGFLVLYLPHRDFYPNIGQPGANPDHKHDFMPNDIKQALVEIAGESMFDVLEDEDRNNNNEYSFYLVVRKLDKPVGMYRPWIVHQKRVGKTVCICRYGAIGDMALASSVIAGWKKRGYYVIVSTTRTAANLLLHDPNVDEIYPFTMDGTYYGDVMNTFWDYLRTRYDVVINLTQSIEGALLPSPELPAHAYSQEVRRKLLNVNYMERTHTIADLPFDFNDLKFYASEAEDVWARDLAEKFTDNHKKQLIGVALAGSSVHKVYPFLQVVLTRLMYETDCVVALFGGEEDKHIEQAIVKHAHAHGIDTQRFITGISSGLSIRKSITLSRFCDVLLGPETGLMQWNAMNDVMKVMMLSHSTITNLTSYWNSTINLMPDSKNVPCYPCHRKHNDWRYCNRGASGASLCMQYPVEQVLSALRKALHLRKMSRMTVDETKAAD